MACEGCETNVKETLESVNGVTGVQVNRNTDSATVEGEPNPEQLEQAVRAAGYEVVQN